MRTGDATGDCSEADGDIGGDSDDTESESRDENDIWGEHVEVFGRWGDEVDV